MATATDNPIATALPSKLAAIHPFTPLSAEEIKVAVNTISKEWPQGTSLQYKIITLNEPPKHEVLPILEKEAKGETFTPLDRKAMVCYYLQPTDKFHESVINLTTQKVEYNVRLGPNVHGPADGDEIMEMERVALSDEGVKAEIAKLKLPEGTVVVVDPWIYGSDGINDDERMWQCFMYMRDPLNSTEVNGNHYAHPLPISPVVSPVTKKVIRIDIMPTGKDNTVKEVQPVKVHAASEYIPELQELRKDLKPLYVSQPEGASFTVREQGGSSVIEWQKWSFRVGFNQREGMVLYNVRYDNRPLFYRMSLSDMTVPYGDPRHPFHKKSAFDLGDAGAGIMANDLKLGCDCLGSIYYLSAVLAGSKGDIMEMNNCVCIHEQDAGIGWKHTNYRTGHAALVRQRELVLQSIITVANYEYILSFHFNQAAELHYEVRATGILSTQPLDEDVKSEDIPWGTIVHPGVLATYHQHIFSLRIDPNIDSFTDGNRLVYNEAHPLPKDDLNPSGHGYGSYETVVKEAGGYNTDYNLNRSFQIQNASKRHPVNGRPVSYKIAAPAFQKIMAQPGSLTHARAQFADKSIYAVQYRDGELYAGGRYTNQSRGTDGVRTWSARKDDVLDKDIVVFVQFGMNHIPRPEDFPVMPSEVIRVELKPVNFFLRNPALDVPPSEQTFNKSVLLSEGHRQPGLESTVVNGTTNGVHAVNGTNGVNGNACH